MWMEHIRFLLEISVEIYDQFYFEPVICLKPDFFLIECAKDLMSMNVSRRLPALYYACPTGQSLCGGRLNQNQTAHLMILIQAFIYIFNKCSFLINVIYIINKQHHRCHEPCYYHVHFFMFSSGFTWNTNYNALCVLTTMLYALSFLKHTIRIL